MHHVATITAVYRYGVKSMAGESLTEASLGQRGIDGDRRLAFRLVNSVTGFPFLSASKHAPLILYKPYCSSSSKGPVPDRVTTPSGEDMELAGHALRQELSEAIGSEVQLMQFKHGIFDDGDLSLISTATIGEIEKQSGMPLDTRRFRPNFVIALEKDIPFAEEAWVGKIVTIGDAPLAPAIAVTMRDLRCTMLNLDPDTGMSNPEILKTVGRLNDVYAGIYGSTVRTGTIHVGDRLFLKEI